MSIVYNKDLVLVFDITISAIEDEIDRLKKIERHLKSRIDKAMARSNMIQPTERLRLERNNLLLEIANWERRLKIAKKRRQKARSDLSYYKAGGSC